MMPYNFSIYLLSYTNVTIQETGNLQGPRIGVCAYQITNNGAINAIGGGCANNEGEGTAQTDECCNHGGGSYGGQGLKGTVSGECPAERKPEIDCGEFLGDQYGTEEGYIAYQGSGGAGTQGGSGGGIIWINVADTITHAGSIEAKGTDSESTVGSTYGSGGGSGGAIVMTVAKIIGNSQATTSVAGGYGSYGGGGGGGGWFYSYILDNYNTTKFPDNSIGWTGNINVLPGGSYSTEASNTSSIFNYKVDITDINYGIRVHPDCLAGYEKDFCSPCIQGFYKTDPDSQDCQP